MCKQANSQDSVDGTESDAAADRRPLGLLQRLRRSFCEPANWLELLRFCVVGASGYGINIAVYAFCVHLLRVDFRLAAVLAFVVALTNNFFWNRYWTFQAKDGHFGFQAARFTVVNLVAFAVNLILLQLLVDAGMTKVAAQALAVALATPVNFIGNKLWSFRK